MYLVLISNVLFFDILSSFPFPACLQERINAMSYLSMPGRFVPKCKQDGSYDIIQCHHASGYCWCADELGREIPDTRVRGKPICGVKGKNIWLSIYHYYL